jgi:hypothetical protein
MNNEDKDFIPPNLETIVPLPNSPKDDLLKEVKNTNEILRQMRDIMYEIHIDLKNNNKLLIETYNKIGESQK